MSTERTPPANEAWTDEAPTDRTELPPALSMLLESTSRQRCKRCGGRAAARCVGCGEAFCRGCVDPVSTGGPDVRCRDCAPRTGERPSQGSPALLEQVLEQILARLSSAPPNPLVNAMRNEALLCQAEIDAWRDEPPSPEMRGAMRERVLSLHAKVQTHEA